MFYSDVTSWARLELFQLNYLRVSKLRGLSRPAASTCQIYWLSASVVQQQQIDFIAA